MLSLVGRLSQKSHRAVGKCFTRYYTAEPLQVVTAIGAYKKSSSKADDEQQSSSFDYELSPSRKMLNENVNLDSRLRRSKFKANKGAVRIFYDENTTTACFGVGSKEGVEKENAMSIDHSRDAIRKSAASVVQALKKDLNSCQVELDCLGDPEAAAEGAFLGLYEFKDLKARKKKDESEMIIEPLEKSETSLKQWKRGEALAYSQNFARKLMNLPASHMNPTLFCEMVKDTIDRLPNSKNVKIHVRDEEWVKQKKMGAFLSVSEGSSQPLKLLEIHYRNATNPLEEPIVIVGKGVTFDTGGYSLKPSAG